MAERIAILRALQLGDLLCAVPALRAIRRARPQARITLIGLPWARDFVARLPYLDDFMEFPGFPGLPERRPDLVGLEAFLAEARARQFDLAIQLHGSGILTNALVALLGARRCAGFHPPGQPCPDPRSFLAWPEELPEIRRLLALTTHLGMPSRGELLELPILPDEAAAFAALRARLPLGGRGYACIHAGARLASRRWLPERFALVGDALAAVGLAVVLTGSAEEAPLLDAIARNMRGPAIDLAGQTTLGTLAALVAAAELVVCNDTGMSHVAAAVGTPSVVICSGADPQRWQPLDDARHRVLAHAVPCRPCAYDECPTGHACAQGISVEAVVRESLSLLSNYRRNHHVAE
ncbi:MAG TPA: glycosyltransferase family 9 protein [Azonexus sp.]